MAAWDVTLKFHKNYNTHTETFYEFEWSNHFKC